MFMDGYTGIEREARHQGGRGYETFYVFCDY